MAHRKRSKRINDKYKGVNSIELIQSRMPDDNRLPMSCMTYQEFKKAREISKRCVKRVRERDALYERMRKSGDMDGKAPSVRVSNSAHPAYELHLYLSEIAEKHGLRDPESRRYTKCVVCGDDIDHKIATENPVCPYCARYLRGGIVRGIDNSAGLKAYGKICSVCHKKPANYNYSGMCKSCYSWGLKIDELDAQKLRRIYLDNGCKRRVKDLQEVDDTIKKTKNPTILHAKDWHLV